jgi:CRP-like cAMP-binding protein
MFLRIPAFAVNLLRIVSRHYKNAMHQIEAMNIKSPLQRVGYYFLLKHIEQGHENLDFKLPFKKQVVANYLGMTPETFSRTLKQMKDIGHQSGRRYHQDAGFVCALSFLRF